MSNDSCRFELEHHYGSHVHLLRNRWLLSALARLSSPEVRHPEMTYILRSVYATLLITAAGNELPAIEGRRATRMVQEHPHHGWYEGPLLDPAAEVVLVDVVRAGIVPAQVCFELLTAVLPDPNVRLDHLNLARVSDAEGHVTGVDLLGSKIGGSVEGKILMLPDPMGATGSTTLRAVDHYLEHYGRPAKVVAMPMIATPEYLRALTDAPFDVAVYTLRLDRGLSPPDVLASPPGRHWERECGLDEHGYIVPGAGGMGEVLNNSWC